MELSEKALQISPLPTGKEYQSVRRNTRMTSDLAVEKHEITSYTRHGETKRQRFACRVLSIEI